MARYSPNKYYTLEEGEVRHKVKMQFDVEVTVDFERTPTLKQLRKAAKLFAASHFDKDSYISEFYDTKEAAVAFVHYDTKVKSRVVS